MATARRLNHFLMKPDVLRTDISMEMKRDVLRTNISMEFLVNGFSRRQTIDSQIIEGKKESDLFT